MKEILQTLIAISCAGFIVTFANSARARSWLVYRADRLKHPFTTLISGLFLMTGSGSLAILAGMDPSAPAWLMPGAATFAVLMSAAFLWAYYFDQYTILENGLSFNSLLGTPHLIAWSEVSEVRYSRSFFGLIVRSRHGPVARITVMLAGLPELSRVLLEKVPPQNIDADTLPILNYMAEGNLIPY